MRRVERSKAKIPASLKMGGKGATERIAARTHIMNPPPLAPGEKRKSFSFAAYKSDDIKVALQKLFHDKCAYCETVYAASAPVDIEHYRPKGAVADDAAHGGYWWLAADWDNLLPSCIDCNRKRGQVLVERSTSLEQLAKSTKPAITQAGKKDSFPLSDNGVRAIAELMEFTTERPLLLDPCRDEPSESLSYSFDPDHPAGLILPAGDEASQMRGAASIQIYGLNRLKLVQDRTRVLRHLEFLGDLVIELSGSIQDLEHPDTVAKLVGTPAEHTSRRLRLLRERTLADLKSATDDDAPYAAMAKAWLSHFKTAVQSGNLTLA